MLPFLLKVKPQTGVIVKTRENPEKDKELEDNGTDLEICAADLLKAVNEKDVAGIAEALQSAYEVLSNQEPYEDESLEAEE